MLEIDSYLEARAPPRHQASVRNNIVLSGLDFPPFTLLGKLSKFTVHELSESNNMHFIDIVPIINTLDGLHKQPEPTVSVLLLLIGDHLIGIDWFL